MMRSMTIIDLNKYPCTKLTHSLPSSTLVDLIIHA